MILKTVEWGDPNGRPLVCVHGVGGYSGNWEHVATDRWGRTFRVISFDLRGHGDSGYEPPWTFKTYVDDIIETIDHLGLEKPDWVGHSFGGRLLLELIARFPERVNRAAVTEPVIQISPELAWHRAEQERLGGIWNSLEEFVGSRENTGSINTEAYLADVKDHFETLEDGRVKRRTNQCAIVAIFSEFASPSPDPSTITMPTLLLYSPAFGMVTPQQVEAYRPYVTEVVGVPGMHAVFTSAYEETSTAIEKFLLA